MPYIPYTVDTSLSHPPNWGLWLKFWDKIFQKLCLCETSACLILHPPPPLTVQEVGSVVTSDKCIAKY